jgi:hypothetical protein
VFATPVELLDVALQARDSVLRKFTRNAERLTRMPSKEIFVLGEGDKEIIDFLEKVRAANGLRVQLGKDVFSVTISSESVSDKGREYLTKGGRVSE